MITAAQLDQLRERFVKHGVVLAYLFGSHAEGAVRASSDVDIAVLLPPVVEREHYLDIQLSLIGDLCEVLGRNDVDVVILNEAAALLAHEVVKHGRILYEDEATRPAIDFTVRAVAYYADTEHFRRLALDYLREAVELFRPRRLALAVQEKSND